MWRLTARLATATLTATLALAVAPAPEAAASAVQSYSYTTSGSISGMSGDLPIEFRGSFGALNSASASSIGEFVTNPLPPTATLTYNNTPFAIDLNVVTKPGSPLPAYDYQVSGLLNGSITGIGTSSMYVSILSVTGNDYGTGATPPFPIAALLLNASLQVAAPVGEAPGVTSLNGLLDASKLPPPLAAPEPASVVMFGTALAGAWLVRRRSRAGARPGTDLT